MSSAAHLGSSGGVFPGTWNRIQLPVSDVNAKAAHLRTVGVKFPPRRYRKRNGQVANLIVDPSGNLVELFQPEYVQADGPSSTLRASVC
jgi:hypothetical protein